MRWDETGHSTRTPDTTRFAIGVTAKATSSRYKRFADQYGTRAVELEALPPETLQEFLKDAVDSVMDVEAFNAELDAEKQDAAFLQDTRCVFKRKLSEVAQ
jgi:hypothetical protein